MIRLYNVLRKFCYLSNTEKTALVEVPNDEVLDTKTEENAGLTKALETYRKLIDRKDLVEPLTEKEQENLQKKIDEIEERVICLPRFMIIKKSVSLSCLLTLKSDL